MEVGHTTVTPGADSRLSRQLLEVEEATNEVTRPFVDTRDIPTVTIAREGVCAVDLSERLEGLCRGVIDRLGSLPVGGEAVQMVQEERPRAVTRLRAVRPRRRIFLSVVMIGCED